MLSNAQLFRLTSSEFDILRTAGRGGAPPSHSGIDGSAQGGSEALRQSLPDVKIPDGLGHAARERKEKRGNCSPPE